jgi:hypothetical protein
MTKDINAIDKEATACPIPETTLKNTNVGTAIK